jgi:hypothetical protein
MSEFATAEAIARRYAHRPGCRFVGAQEVGIAVYLMDLRIIIVEPRDIPPVDEFLLRAIDLSVGVPAELSRFLGLDSRTVDSRLVELRRAELIELDPMDETGRVHCRLTIKGKSATDSLQQAVLSEVTLPQVAYHGFLRKPLPLREEHLLRPRDLREQGMRAIPAIPGRPPRPEEIKLVELAEVIKQYWARRKKGKTPELVSVRSVLRDVRTMYQQAVLLQYEPIGRNKQPQLAFAVEGVVDDEYEKAFAACKGHERIPDLVDDGYISTAALAADLIKPHLVKALGPIGDLDELQEKLDVIDQVVEEKEAIVSVEDRPDTKRQLLADLERERSERAELEKKLSERKARRLKTHECRPLMLATLREAKERVVIVSAFLSTEAVDDGFLNLLEAALVRGVNVWIAYGLGGGHGGRQHEREYSSDWTFAEEDLKKLERKYSSAFHLRDLGGTHEKILIRDEDFVVSGSFNWLSFRGERGRRFRYEDALQVTEAGIVKEYFQEIASRFKKKGK